MLTKEQLEEIGNRLPASAWRLVEETEGRRTYEAWLDKEGNTRIQRHETIGDEELVAWNQHLYDTSGRFSQREAGAIGTPVANIPMTKFFDDSTELAKRIRDRDYMKWWLNSEAARPYRTQKGKI